MGVPGLPRSKKNAPAVRELVSLFTAYGSGFFAGRLLDFGTYLGLWLNADRARYHHALAVSRGFAAASGAGDLDPAWFDALASTPAEAAEMKYRSDGERMEARVRRKVGWG
jgi:hypothetical protein